MLIFPIIVLLIALVLLWLQHRKNEREWQQEWPFGLPEHSQNARTPETAETVTTTPEAAKPAAPTPDSAPNETIAFIETPNSADMAFTEIPNAADFDRHLADKDSRHSDKAEFQAAFASPAADLDVISLEDVRHFQAQRIEIETESMPEPVHAPAADLEVISLSEATRSRRSPLASAEEVPPPVQPLETITLDDPILTRVRERRLTEIAEIHVPQADIPPPNTPESAKAAAAPLETIEIGDIRTSLLRQRLARQRQQPDAPQTAVQAAVIPEDEVMANLAHTDSPVHRRSARLKRITPRDSVIPETTRVNHSHGSRLQPAEPPRTSQPVRLARANPPEPAAPVSVSAPPAALTPAPAASFVSTDIPAAEFAAPAIDIAAPVQTEPTPFDAPQIFPTVFDLNEPAAAELPDNSQPFTFADTDEPCAPQPPRDESGFEKLPETAAVSTADSGKNHIYDETADTLPPVSLLLPPQYDPSAVPQEEILLENSITIEEKLAEYRVKVKVLDAYSGPVITRYEIQPDTGVRGSSILNLEKDLARSLGLASIRVIETIPGKTCMGLELPNPKRQMIRLSEIINSPLFSGSSSKLTLALGQDITGKPVVTDLAKAPHLLVAGTTGSGKSVGVNSMILSMLFKAQPEDVRMIMIDPKMLELSIYEGIPHLLCPVVTDMRLAANALNWCVNEMEKRYRLMSHVGVRNLEGYNRKVQAAAAQGKRIANPFSLTPEHPEPLEKLPFIVVVVDEFADLMMTAGKKIEELIARITQKARAAGIHLILATQRPSVDVITGLIKANIPTRLAFQVASKIDSRTILDQMGAENLLGQGDMLFLPPGSSYPQRVHGAFVADEEVHEIVEYLKQFEAPYYIDDILSSADEGEDEGGSEAGSGSEDQFDEAVAIVLRTQKTSISHLQRKLRVGYNKAADLIEQMESEGILSAPDHSGKRTILARNGNH